MTINSHDKRTHSHTTSINAITGFDLLNSKTWKQNCIDLKMDFVWIGDGGWPIFCFFYSLDISIKYTIILLKTKNDKRTVCFSFVVMESYVFDLVKSNSSTKAFRAASTIIPSLRYFPKYLSHAHSYLKDITYSTKILYR